MGQRISHLLAASWGAALYAQAPLTLAEAVRISLEKHPSIAATRSGISAAEARLRQAKSGWLPKVNYQESWQRSNNPVFVFSSRLMQRRFTEQNFAINDLNHPDSINNFQSMVSVDQTLFDAGQTGNAKRAAELGRQMATEDRRRVEQDLIGRVARIYHAVLLTGELVRVAEEAVKSAEADLARAEARLSRA